MARIERWSALPARHLWRQWRALFVSDGAAIAHAVWCANRLVKGCSPAAKHRFYEIKEEWLQRHQGNLVRGRIARIESQPCGLCDGYGCLVCTDGVGSQRILYLHEIEVAGQLYSFHSYSAPCRVDSERAEDCAQYGRDFTTAEEAVLPLPIAGILKVLDHVREHVWTPQTGPPERSSQRPVASSFVCPPVPELFAA
jgi:hypothetical protein